VTEVGKSQIKSQCINPKSLDVKSQILIVKSNPKSPKIQIKSNLKVSNLKSYSNPEKLAGWLITTIYFKNAMFFKVKSTTTTQYVCICALSCWQKYEVKHEVKEVFNAAAAASLCVAAMILQSLVISCYVWLGW